MDFYTSSATTHPNLCVCELLHNKYVIGSKSFWDGYASLPPLFHSDLTSQSVQTSRDITNCNTLYTGKAMS